MKTLFIPLVFAAIFLGCAYNEHLALQDRLDAEAEYRANARELAADFLGDDEVTYARF